MQSQHHFEDSIQSNQSKDRKPEELVTIERVLYKLAIQKFYNSTGVRYIPHELSCPTSVICECGNGSTEYYKYTEYDEEALLFKTFTFEVPCANCYHPKSQKESEMFHQILWNIYTLRTFSQRPCECGKSYSTISVPGGHGMLHKYVPCHSCSTDWLNFS